VLGAGNVLAAGRPWSLQQQVADGVEPEQLVAVFPSIFVVDEMYEREAFGENIFVHRNSAF
jgi:hypothetical protein